MITLHVVLLAHRTSLFPSLRPNPKVEQFLGRLTLTSSISNSSLHLLLPRSCLFPAFHLYPFRLRLQTFQASISSFLSQVSRKRRFLKVACDILLLFFFSLRVLLLASPLGKKKQFHFTLGSFLSSIWDQRQTKERKRVATRSQKRSFASSITYNLSTDLSKSFRKTPSIVSTLRVVRALWRVLCTPFFLLLYTTSSSHLLIRPECIEAKNEKKGVSDRKHINHVVRRIRIEHWLRPE